MSLPVGEIINDDPNQTCIGSGCFWYTEINFSGESISFNTCEINLPIDFATDPNVATVEQTAGITFNVSITYDPIQEEYNIMGTDGLTTGPITLLVRIYVQESQTPGLISIGPATGTVLSGSGAEDITFNPNIAQLNVTEDCQSCADPHVKPFYGPEYDLPNIDTTFKLLDNQSNPRISMNSKCWFLPEDEFLRLKEVQGSRNISWAKNSTYHKYTQFRYGDETLIIDLDTMEPVEYTNETDLNSYQLKPFTPKLNHIKMGEMTEDSNGLYYFKIKKSRPGLTKRRVIELGDITIKLASNLLDTCRNSISVNYHGTAGQYMGALLREGDHVVEGINGL